ncbi:uncharacterized protein LOC131942790 [Physella acuta]|uniref:uncharacterized protein LOC131942790 n=1 Tax=Physella acuta TaxID=109671 RepID=UPI0027DD3204|nr:uncharacterized protein LOC131942790 [Physella acuta]
MDFCATYKRLLTFRDLPQTDGICKLTLAENGFYLKDAQASCFTCMSCRIEFTPTSFPKEQNRWHDTSCPFHVDHPRYQQLTQNYGSTYADQSSLLRPSRSNIRQETGMEQDHIFYSVHETYSGGAYNIVEQNCEDGGIQDVPNDVLPTQDENVEGSPYNPYPTLEQSVVDVHNHQNSTQEENINSAFYNVNSNLMETMENAGTILNGIHEETMTGASNYMNQIQETTTPDASQTLTSSSVPLSAPVSMHRERSKRGSQSVVVSLAEAKSLGAASRLSHETHPPGNSES